MWSSYLVQHFSFKIQEAILPSLAEKAHHPIVDNRITLETETLVKVMYMNEQRHDGRVIPGKAVIITSH